LNGQVAAFVLLPGRGDASTSTPNVVSERAFKQLGKEALEEEYGPVELKIRLVPPFSVLKEIKQEWQTKLEAEKSKKSKKADKKRKLQNESTGNDNGRSKNGKLTEAARPRVSAAVKSSNNNNNNNAVLSSLFTTADAKISDKDKRDNLFAR
jgi:hypothetical protein